MAVKIGKLHYAEALFDHLKNVRRWSVETWILIGSIGLLGLVGGFGFVMHLIRQLDTPDTGDLQVTITNASALPITDFGFQSSENLRWVSLGPVAAGQTKIISTRYLVNDCLEDMSFDQAGQTFYAKLEGSFPTNKDPVVFKLIVKPNHVVDAKYETCLATTQISQPASTQPLVYLDQNGKPLPVMR